MGALVRLGLFALLMGLAFKNTFLGFAVFAGALYLINDILNPMGKELVRYMNRRQ